MRTILISIGIISVILLIGMVIFLPLSIFSPKNNQINSGQNIPSKVVSSQINTEIIDDKLEKQIADWKIYRDPQHSIEFKYPSTWEEDTIFEFDTPVRTTIVDLTSPENESFGTIEVALRTHSLDQILATTEGSKSKELVRRGRMFTEYTLIDDSETFAAIFYTDFNFQPYRTLGINVAFNKNLSGLMPQEIIDGVLYSLEIDKE